MLSLDKFDKWKFQSKISDQQIKYIYEHNGGMLKKLDVGHRMYDAKPVKGELEGIVCAWSKESLHEVYFCVPVAVREQLESSFDSGSANIRRAIAALQKGSLGGD